MNNQISERYYKILNGMATWGSYYRENPDKFAEDYLHINLKLFQRVALIEMFMGTTFVFVASRGLGKTFLSAIYCCIRCILYPGTKICVASGAKHQAVLVLQKIMLELLPNSAELRCEIDEKRTKVNNTDAIIRFKNGSYIKVVTVNDGARGNRANVLLLDEFRLISFEDIDQILKKFLYYRRTPPYNQLTKEERLVEYNKEKNLTMYLTSAYYKSHWAYLKCIDAFKASLREGSKNFICAFPYQLAIAEGMLDPESVAEDMRESTFSITKWNMEMGALWFGSDEDAFFDLESLTAARKLAYPMIPNTVAEKIANSDVLRIAPKKAGEIRILSVDVALMASGKIGKKKKKNDATSEHILQLLPTKTGRYMINVIYTDSQEGLRTDDQALEIRRMYDIFDCDYMALDTLNAGLGIYDEISKDLTDMNTGDVYPALSCCNDPSMAMRCVNKDAPKVVWSIKANAQFNSDYSQLLRDAIRSKRIRFLMPELEAEEYLSQIKGYNSLAQDEKIQIKLPYIYTELLIEELTNLLHKVEGNRVQIYERSGERKDRYSSLLYGYYVARQLEGKLIKNSYQSNDPAMYIIRPPASKRASNTAGIYKRNK